MDRIRVGDVYVVEYDNIQGEPFTIHKIVIIGEILVYYCFFNSEKESELVMFDEMVLRRGIEIGRLKKLSDGPMVSPNTGMKKLKF